LATAAGRLVFIGEKAVDDTVVGLRRSRGGCSAEGPGSQYQAMRAIAACGAYASALDAENDAIALGWAAFFGRPEVDFAVEDISAAVERAMHAGAALQGAVQSHGRDRLATLHDPFGHEFCLLQFVRSGHEEEG
jgi:hypothetical protein